MKTDEVVYVIARGEPTGHLATKCVWKAGGLAVTQWLGLAVAGWDEDDGFQDTTGKYVVTHLPTGGTIYKHPMTEDEAIGLAESLRTMTDWSSKTLTDMVRGPKEKEGWATTVGAHVAAFHKARSLTTETND